MCLIKYRSGKKAFVGFWNFFFFLQKQQGRKRTPQTSGEEAEIQGSASSPQVASKQKNRQIQWYLDQSWKRKVSGEKINCHCWVVQLVDHALPKLVGWVQFLVGSYRRLEKRYMLPVQPRARPWWVEGNGSRIVLPLTRHQCKIHCESSRVTHDARKRCWAPQTTHDTPERSTKLEYKRYWIEPFYFPSSLIDY